MLISLALWKITLHKNSFALFLWYHYEFGHKIGSNFPQKFSNYFFSMQTGKCHSYILCLWMFELTFILNAYSSLRTISWLLNTFLPIWFWFGQEFYSFFIFSYGIQVFPNNFSKVTFSGFSLCASYIRLIS